MPTAAVAQPESLSARPFSDPLSTQGVYFFPDEFFPDEFSPDGVPFADAASDDLCGQPGWDGVIPLRRSDIRRQPRWAAGLSRTALGLGRRHLAAAGLLASCALLAACASAARSVPEAQTAAAVPAPAIRLSAAMPALRGGRPASAPVQTASLETAPEPAVYGRGDQAPAATPDIASPQVASPEGSATDSAAVGEMSVGAASPAPASDSGWFRRDASPEQPVTKLVAFASAPFPYQGAQPGGSAFLNVYQDGQRGHRGRRGQILWEGRTFSDNRVLVHVPAHFDPDRPAVMVLFLHGYGATLSRDVAARQQVPAQISASGANAVLVAPQFAVDARDPSIGHFWEPGGFRNFLRESAQQLARASGNPGAAERFAHMPIVIVAYSGGFYSGAFCLKDIAGSHRVRGILMLDAAYGEFERYADWAADNRSSFLVSSYTRYTARQNAGLKSLLAARGVPINANLNASLAHGGATFLPADYSHNDYVTQAWTENPIRDLLTRIPELRDPQALASMDMTATASIH